MRRAPRVVRLAVPALVAVAVLAGASSVRALTAGSIGGKVVNGSDDTSAANVKVTLQLFSVQADLGTLTTRTDRGGRFSFAELPDGVAGYQLAAVYEGTTYRSVTTGFTAGQTVEQTLEVWDPTTDPKDVAVTDYIVWVDRSTTGDGLAIQHDFAWTNGGVTAYVGGDDGVVTVPLPPAATGMQYLGTFLENPGDVVDGSFVSDAPIVPGDSTATIRYDVPAATKLPLSTQFPASSVQLFVPEGISVTTTALRRSGTIQDEVQGGGVVTYQVYAAEDVAAGTTIDVTLSDTGDVGGSRTALWIVVALGTLLILGAAVAVAVRRSTRRARRPSTREGARPARAKARVGEPKGNGHRERAAPRAAGGGASGASATEDADLIVEEIAALDLSFERGLLDERTYRRLRVAAKDRLLRAEGARAGGGGSR